MIKVNSYRYTGIVLGCPVVSCCVLWVSCGVPWYRMHPIHPDKMKGPRLYICTKNMAAIGRGRGRGRGLLAREAPTESASKPGGLGDGDEKVYTRLEHEIFEFRSEIS